MRLEWAQKWYDPPRMGLEELLMHLCNPTQTIPDHDPNEVTDKSKNDTCEERCRADMLQV